MDKKYRDNYKRVELALHRVNDAELIEILGSRPKKVISKALLKDK